MLCGTVKVATKATARQLNAQSILTSCRQSYESSVSLIPLVRWSSLLVESADGSANISESPSSASIDEIVNAPSPLQATTTEKPKLASRPRASNPSSFQKKFFVRVDQNNNGSDNRKNRTPSRVLDRHEQPSRRVGQRRKGVNDARGSKTHQPLRSSARTVLQYTEPMPHGILGLDGSSQVNTLGNHLKAQGETIMPTSTWVQVEGISPISSLEAMLAGIHEVLNAEDTLGMIDLDAAWGVGQDVPFLPPRTSSIDDDDKDKEEGAKQDKWVRKALLILSPFGRPTGWYLQFDNRSVVYALLKHAEEKPVHCTWKSVKLQEYKGINGTGDDEVDVPVSHGNYIVHEGVSDHTLRVENCPPSVNDVSLLNFFSRYDLQFGEQAIQRWQGMTSDGKKCPPTTCLVHFADASWARAALREKQATFIQKFGKRIVVDESNPQPLRLIQYPRQIL